VLPNGELMTTSRRARKSSAGYDLTRLVVGAEGTLGVITELTLKLHPIPEATAAGVCRFPTVKACCDTAITAIQMGIPVGRVELLDEVQIRVSNVHSKTTMAEEPTLFVEFIGTDASVAEQAERFGEIVADNGGSPFEWATRLEDRNRLWQVRHEAFWGQRSYRPGAQVLVTDVCVPVSRLAECVTATKEDIERTGLLAPIPATSATATSTPR
jgi:D-lactate dehydrogenase (cytochrome)